MKKMLIFIVCIICLFVTGCMKQDDKIGAIDISNEFASGDILIGNSNINEEDLSVENNGCMKEYKDLMDLWGRNNVEKIVFIDSSIEQFDREYSEKAEIYFCGDDRVNAYLDVREKGNIIYFVSNGEIHLKDANRLFEGFTSCQGIQGMKLLNTEKVSNMEGMFAYCESLEVLDVSFFKTSQVTTMAYMFEYCKKLRDLNLFGFDTSNVTRMEKMFYCCNALSFLDIGDFDTSNVESTENMFKNYRNSEYFYPESSNELIIYRLYEKSNWELNLAKNEIFARHGHDFTNKKLKAYFDSREWYQPIEGKSVVFTELNEIEQANVALIERIIKRRKESISGIEIKKAIEAPNVECNWDKEFNKYPLDEKILCYEGEYNQNNEKNRISIYFEGYDYLDYATPYYEVILNDTIQEFYADEFYIVDLDNTDEYIEMVTYNYWENGFFTTIYRYINGEILCIGDDITSSIVGCEFDGYKYYNEEIHFLEETLIPRYYVFENGEIERAFVKYDEVKDKTYTVTHDMLSEIACYDKLKIGDKIRILSLTDETDYITGESQGLILRVMNESGEIFEIGYAGSWT